MLIEPSSEQRTSAGDGGTTSRHLQALLPSRAALSPEGYHVLSSACGSKWVRISDCGAGSATIRSEGQTDRAILPSSLSDCLKRSVGSVSKSLLKSMLEPLALFPVRRYKTARGQGRSQTTWVLPYKNSQHLGVILLYLNSYQCRLGGARTRYHACTAEEGSRKDSRT